MEQVQRIDLSEVFSYFPAEQADGKVCYKIDLPEEIYRSMTYTRPPSQASIRLAQNLAQREIDSGIDTPVHQGYKPSSRAKKGPTVAVSPYEFRQKEIPQTWKSIYTFDQSSIQRAQLPGKKLPFNEDIKATGSTAVFNTKYARISPSAKNIMPYTDIIIEDDIQDDPVIQEIAKEETKYGQRIFATAKVMAAIIACPRSLHQFELSMDKIGKDVYVKPVSNDSTAIIETSLETFTSTRAVDREKATADFPKHNLEATRVCSEFINFCKDKTKPVKFTEEGPAFLYRRIIINNVEYIIRCQVDAVRSPVKAGERPQYLMCRILNEGSTDLRRVTWDRDLERQRGAIFTLEANANAAKVARWVAIGHLMEADGCMIGYATRKPNAGPDSGHHLLGVERHSPLNLSRDIGLTVKNIYGVMDLIFSNMERLSDGNYMFVRDSKQKKTYSLFATGSGRIIDDTIVVQRAEAAEDEDDE